jgi:hypothetical protein
MADFISQLLVGGPDLEAHRFFMAEIPERTSPKIAQELRHQ